MKLHVENQNFEGIVPANRIPFKIATNAKLFGILSDGIYKDKILAVIRELSCNAHDVHVQTKRAKPFRVYVPNRLEPTFAVEDEGTGIDPARIADIYWTYGESSKTQSNEQIGALGLGSKSPFAYTKSSFVVKNRWQGTEYTYFCFINETGVPDGSLISEVKTDKPDGITVELAARDEDIRAFYTRICSFFKYWDTKPEFIGDDIIIPTPKKVFEGTSWFYEERDSYNSNALAIMGNVPYPIDVSSIPSPSPALKFIATNSFVITFPLGDLAFQASREELSYEKATIDALEKAAKVIYAELKKAIVEEIVKDVTTPLQLMRRFKGMHKSLEARLRNTHTLQGKIMHFFEKDDKFVLPSGAKFNAEELAAPRVTFDLDGHSPLGIYVNNGYSSTGRWTLKQARSVVMKLDTTRTDPKDSTKTVPHEIIKTVPWFRPSTKPMKTVNPLSMCSMLAEGYKAVKTSLTVDMHSYGLLDFEDKDEDVVRFIVNDYGTRGGTGFRIHAKKYHFPGNKTFFVEADASSNVPDFGVSAIRDMLVGTVFEGAEVILLSQLKDFELPKADAKDKVTTVKQPAQRGTTEVRMLTFKLHPGRDGAMVQVMGETYRAPYYYDRSGYERITVAGCTKLYVVSSKGSYEPDDKRFLTKDAANMMAWLFLAGAFKDYMEADGTLKVISRKQVDIDLLKSKGANIKRLNEVITEFMKRPEIDAAYTTISQAEALFTDDALDDLTAPSHRKILLAQLTGKGTFFEQAVGRAEQLLENLKLTKGTLAALHGVAVNRPMFGMSNPIIKHADKDEMLKRYPLFPLLTEVRYNRDYSIRGKQLDELAANRLRHIAMYIIAADKAYNEALAKSLAAEEKKKVA